jgi:hyperosmotically inducible periplasmic protein
MRFITTGATTMSIRNPKTTIRVLAASVLAAAIGMANANDPQAQDTATNPSAVGESEQPMGDTWITTKVKAELLANQDVSGLDISVETVNGVVTLSGDVGTQAEADRAVALAQSIEGVTRVDSSRINVTGDAEAETP